ncbi:hypothetical protein CPC08DRAFT_727947 [Agrocybe pediades]|nr:hypothetical protein CPC08DRAFT_727947 [Agrocybe pediades]
MFSTRRQKKRGVEWFKTSVKNGDLLLSIIQDAASLTLLPDLRHAAGVTFRIVEAGQLVRYNKAGVRRLAEYATTFIVIMHDRYLRNSTQKEQTSWPPPNIARILQELLETLKEFLRFVEDKASKDRIIRLLNSITDARKVKEYHQRLYGVEEKLRNISVIDARLSLDESVALILKKLEEGQSSLKQAALEEPDNVQAKIEADRRRNQELEVKRTEERRQIDIEAKQRET